MNALLAQYEFTRPLALLLLVAAPLLFALSLRSRREAAGWRRAACAVCRTALIVLLALAAAGMTLRQATDQQYVVFVVDVSDSTSGAPRQQAQEFLDKALSHRRHHVARIVPFAGEVGSSRRRIDLDRFENETEKLATDRSNPSAAMLQAAAAIPDGYHGKIVLLSDARQTVGNLLAASAGAGMPVHTVPLEANNDEVALLRVTASRRQRSSGAFTATVVMRSNHDDQGQVELLLGGKSIASKEVQVDEGQTVLTFPLVSNTNETVRLEAQLNNFSDRHAGNNRGATQVLTEEPARVLLVDREKNLAEHFRKTLAGQGCQMQWQSPEDAALTDASLAPFDLLILSDIEPKDISDDRLAAVEKFVASGGGLIVVGGDKTYAADALAGSRLEELLPVKATQQTQQRQASLAMVLVVDKSASMLEENRLALAKEGAKRVVGLLGENDRVGLIAYGSDSQWITQLAPLANRQQLLQQIDTLKAEGRTNMYPALERAALALEQTEADARHVILLTDGVSSPGDFDPLARRMARAGVRVSTVSVGAGADQTILQDVARIAEGRHRHCDRAEDLAQIVVEVAQRAVRDAPPSEFPPVVVRRLPAWKEATPPPLLGYAATDSKPRVQLLMMSTLGHPLLCWRRHGGGVVAALTADVKNRWANRWQSWPQYSHFWDAIVQLARRKRRPDPLDLSWRRRGETATIDVDVFDPSHGFLNDAKVELTIDPPTGDQQEVVALQVAPGRYQATFPAPQFGPYTVKATVALNGEERVLQRTVVFSADYDEELRLAPVNETLLQAAARVSGGKYRPRPEDVFAAGEGVVSRLEPLWHLLLTAAVLVFLLDVFWRRFDFSPLGRILRRQR